MPYTHEKTSNTIEDKNNNSRTYFHCGPQHKPSGLYNKINKKIFSSKYKEKKTVTAPLHYSASLSSNQALIPFLKEFRLEITI